MEFRLYFQILRRGWWIILLTTLSALLAALIVSYLATPQYKAVARFIITPGSELADRYQVLNSLNTLDNVVITATYAEIMNSDRIYLEALSFLQLQDSDLKDYKYEALVIPSTSVLELTVTGPDPEMVAKLANAVGTRAINFVRQLNQVYSFDFLDIPVTPAAPYSPNPILNSALATALGLLSGALLAILNEQLRIPFESFRQRFHFDAITGVYTSKYFSRIIYEELSKNPDTVFTIGIVELNGVRDMVDALPLAGIQNILQRVTGMLRRELRGNDVIGRWNEFSFIVMLPNTRAMAAKSIFDRIFNALVQPFEFEQLVTTVDFDPIIGGAEYSNSITPQELFEKATSALDQARRSNEESVYIWEMKNPFWTQLTAGEN